MTKTCVNCGGNEPDVKFSGTHRKCNRCRNVESRAYLAEYQRKNRAKNRERHRLATRKYREEQPHIPFYTTSRYQARKIDVYSDLTKEDAYDVYHSPDKCAYCGKERTDTDGPRSYHIDHVIPMSQGGPNSRWNLVKTCISCNTSKGFDSLVAFRERTPMLTDDRYDAVISGMAMLHGHPIAYINELLTQSNAFEVAFQRERAIMQSLLYA